MNDWFVDTSGWAVWLRNHDPFHSRAADLVTQARRDNRLFVTTNYVLAELAALLSSPIRLPGPTQIQLLGTLRNTSWVQVVQVDQTLDASAWQLWEARSDKEWSLVDCASFVVMQQRGLTEAITLDHHFEQAGFVRLLQL